ncbi:MAG: DUF6261 family protein [Prevotellaceae bacterium]|jgi:hypothetical protein|nr:DUF6261 family protein [Prevotellaceae bacterium]
MKITRIHLENLRNEAHCQYLAFFVALLVKFPAIIEKIGNLLELFNSKFLIEKQVLDFVRKSDYSEKIREADRNLDKFITGFVETIRGAIKHRSQAVSEAAVSLTNLMKTYKNITRKNYDEELASVNSLLKELTGEYSDRIAVITGLDEWVEDIRSSSEILAELLALRTAEKAAKPQDRMIGIRREVDPLYRKIIAKIDAFILIEGEENYIAFITDINALIDRYNKIRPYKSKQENSSDEKSE